MDQKSLIIGMIKAKFGITPSDAQLKKIQDLAKNRKLSNDEWLKLAEGVLRR